jgi:exonuclease SbcC
MPVTIRARNFQSIEDAELKVSGLTVVTGANNSGKSALMRAIRGVFENPGGDAFVRHGTDAFAVDLDFGDATVTWSKGPKVKPTYVIGGKTIHPGRGVPDEVTDLNVAPVKAGNTDVWPQIAPQFTGQVFLLDMPGSAVAEAVSDVDRVSRLTEALRLAESDKRSAASELKLRKKDLTDAEADYARYDGLDAAVDVWTTAMQSHAVVVALDEDRTTATRLHEALKSAQAKVGALDGIRHVTTPDVAEAKALQADVLAIRELASTLDGCRRAVATLPSNVPVPNATQAQALASETAIVASLAGRLAKARQAVGKYDVSIATPAVEFPEKLSTAIRNLNTLKTNLDSAKERILVEQADLDKALSELTTTQADVQTMLSEVDHCPTCNVITRLRP